MLVCHLDSIGQDSVIINIHLSVVYLLAVLLCLCFPGGWELNWGSLWSFRSLTEVSDWLIFYTRKATTSAKAQ